MSHLAKGVLLAGCLQLVGCGGRAPVETVWAMPAMQPQPQAADPQRGYPFAYATTGVPGGDSASSGGEGRDGHPGDLPETMYDAAGRFWIADEAAAIREAQDSGRGVLIQFYAEWCDSCRLLRDETLRDFDVRSAIRRRFVPLRIDVTEETFVNRDQLERYKVMHLPAIVMMDVGGNESDRIEQYVPAVEMLSRLTAGNSVTK
jgi:thiol-disulfide isomerase/thioredoxin